MGARGQAQRQSKDGAADQSYLHLLKGVTFEPVFIMGVHRSGTTLLYQLLSQTGQFNVVTAYHIIGYDALLYHHAHQTTGQAMQRLRAEFDALGLGNRLIDGVAVSPTLPEEYGFRLANGGPRPQLRPDNLDSFDQLCRKVQYTSAAAKPLLLKNPWDFRAFLFIRQVFPSARFIFLHRNPVDVVSSQLRATRQTFAAKNPYIARLHPWYDRLFDRPVRLALTRLMFARAFGIGLRVTTRNVRRAATYFLDHIDALPPESAIALTYEALCQNPEERVAAVLDFLGLAAGAARPATRIAPGGAALEPDVQANVTFIRRQLRPYLAYCGYDG